MVITEKHIRMFQQLGNLSGKLLNNELFISFRNDDDKNLFLRDMLVMYRQTIEKDVK